jgi:glycosyltransferase involved in cell wall biosynthesis
MPDQSPESQAKPSVAIVVQRYGNEIGGGSEYACQLIAERMNQYYNVQVLTTCAKDYRTWKNEYEAGATEVNGIPVRRFRVQGERDTAQFERVWEKIFWRDHSPEDEMDFFRFQGPYTPELLDYIRKNRSAYDAFLFCTYLYYPTALGLPLVGPRAVFLPTAHDEAPLYLNHFDRIFHATPHLVFLSEEERQLVQRRFTLDSAIGSVVGVGIDNPWSTPDEPGWNALKQRLGDSKVVTYVGRVDAGKGCAKLVEFFLRYPRSRHREGVKLLLLGRNAMDIPDHPDIIAPGFVSDYVKAHAVAASSVSVAPSPLESLCMAAHEAWYQGCPLLVNGQCNVLVGHCLRSNGGLWYENYEEFESALGRLLEDANLARKLGRQGQEYISANCRWSQVEKLYCRILDGVINSGKEQGSSDFSPSRSA